MRPTRAGLGVLAIGVVVVGLGRLFGAFELFLLGAGLLAAFGLAALVHLTLGLDLGVSRTTSPAVLRAGTPAQVDLVLHNRARRSTPVMELIDQVENTQGARLHLAAIRRGDDARVSYRLPTRRRGPLSVGPLSLDLGDPLGLVHSRIQAAGTTPLVVRPALLDFTPVRATAGHDPVADTQRHRALAVAGEEFHSLRPYVVGDELRRVHWPHSARSGELVVRTEERARTGRVTIALDIRRDPEGDPEAFERAVSAALSALVAAHRGGEAVQFVTTGLAPPVEVRNRTDLDRLDEELATITTTEAASLVRTVEQLGRSGRGGLLVTVSTAVDSDLAATLVRARRRFAHVITVVCGDGAPVGVSGIVRHDGVNDPVAEWSRAVRTRSTS